MAPSPSGGDRGGGGELLSTAASVGVFIITAVLCQWASSRRNDEDGSRCGSNNSTEDVLGMRKRYQYRRLHDRLSYEDLNKYRGADHRHLMTPGSPSPVLNPIPKAKANPDGFSIGVQKQGNRRRRSTLRSSISSANALAEARLTSPNPEPNCDYDFHPKNRNWRHFERMASEDRIALDDKSNLVEMLPDIPTLITEEDLNKSDSKSCSGLSMGSEEFDDDGSEEDFVWTKSKAGKPTGLRTSRSIDTSGSMSHLESAATLPIENLSKPPLSRTEEPLRRNTSEGESKKEGRTSATSTSSSILHRLMSSLTSTADVDMEEDVSEFDDEDIPDNQQIRAAFNASIMPEKLIMIRHGQSMGNINELLYSTTPDNTMPLTDLGWEQARMAGKVLKEKLLEKGGDTSVHFIVSPYTRTVETFHGIVSAWCDPKQFDYIEDREDRVKAWYGRLMEMGLTWNEDSRIREQDFGNYQDPETIKRAKQERHRFGVFYYRFPHGESASDVFDRVSTFLDSMWRSFDMNRSRNYVLVTHGISIRVLLARYFRYTIEQFNMISNPRNCEMVILKHTGDGKLELNGRCALEQEGNKVTGYKFHKRLRVVPQAAIRKVRVRISADDIEEDAAE